MYRYTHAEWTAGLRWRRQMARRCIWWALLNPLSRSGSHIPTHNNNSLRMTCPVRIPIHRSRFDNYVVVVSLLKCRSRPMIWPLMLNGIRTRCWWLVAGSICSRALRDENRKCSECARQRLRAWLIKEWTNKRRLPIRVHKSKLIVSGDKRAKKCPL